MTTYDTAGGANPRALLSAAALGSLAGLALGGAYLAGASARHTAGHATWAQLRTQELPAATVSPAGVQPSSSPERLAQVDVQADAAPKLQAVDHLLPVHLAASPFRQRAVQTSESDQRCLTQAVYYEARGESAAGQEAVAQVVLNRVRHPAFPKSVCGVVFQRADAGCQFSFACDGRMKAPRDAEAWRRSQVVAQRALDGFVMRQVGQATHFHVFNIGPAWSASLARIGQIGAHVFYGFTGHAGAARMFQAKAEPSTAPGRAATASFAMASLDGGDAARVHAVLIPSAPAPAVPQVAPQAVPPTGPTPTSVVSPQPQPTAAIKSTPASAPAPPASAPVATMSAPVATPVTTPSATATPKPSAT